MAQRVNAITRIYPDQSGNYSGINTPSGQPIIKLSYKDSELDPYLIKEAAANKAAQFKDIEKRDIENNSNISLGKAANKIFSGISNSSVGTSAPDIGIPDVDTPKVDPPKVDAGAIAKEAASNRGGDSTQLGVSDAKPGKGKSGMSPKGKAAAANIGLGVATAAAGIGGEYLSNNKQEVAGGALKGAAQGASAGMLLGPIGAGVGAIVGAGVGALMGNREKGKREGMEFTQEADRKMHNFRMDKLRNKTIGKAEDLAAYQSIINSSGKTGSYKSGGLLRYYEVDMEEAQEYLNTLIKEREITKHQMGGEIDPLPSNTDKLLSTAYKMIKEGKAPKEIAKVLKVDEKTFKLIMSKAIKLKRPPKPGEAITPTAMYREGGPIFDFNMKSLRRGGPIDIAKQNVIVDGPSHDDLNNTGIKGDKGIPVVHKGVKVAEIESKELVINSKAMNEIEALRDAIERGDKDVVDKLGELLIEELGGNTYDYNKEL